MKAVIMAGGEGARLRPMTCNCPKPMVPIANKPVMEHILELLKRNDFYEIAVTLQYMPELIKEHFDDGTDYGVKLRYYTEKVPLGTAGSVKNAEKFLDDTFLVISGDSLTDIDLKKAIDFHVDKGSVATLILKKVDIPLEYGVVVTDYNDRITRFVEKPGWGEVFSDTVNTGIYILSPEVLKYYKRNEFFDFSKDLFPLLLNKEIPMFGYVTDDYWCDIGDLKAYIQTHNDILDGKVRINVCGRQVQKGVWIDEGVDIRENVSISQPCIIGKNSIIKKDALIGSYCIIGENNIIEERSSIKRSIIWKNSIIDNNVQLRGSILCNKVHMGNNASAFECSVVGDDTVVRENAIIKPNIKIWPNKLIGGGTVVNSNLVWGSKFSKSIFGNRGIAGEINVDITPEYASKLGAAYGALHRNNERIAVSCDGSPASNMIKISLSSGLLSTGLEVYDFDRMLLPITRSAVRFYRLDGGIHISTCTNNQQRLSIEFLDKNGSNVMRGIERKIENTFIREDFSRCEGECISNINHIEGYSKFYIRNTINNLKSTKYDYKIALNSRSEFITETIKDILNELGCEVEHTDLRLMNAITKGKSKTYGDVRFFTSHIVMGGFDVGVSIEDTSEKMMLVDNKGRIITEDMFIALISLILFKTIKGGTVVVPISASHVIEKIASEHNGKVIRSKTSSYDLMDKILGVEAKAEMLEQFTMHFDAIAGMLKILDFMWINKFRLSDLVDMIPEFHINRRKVECPWNVKGKVIREIIEEKGSKKIETMEGVKIYNEDGWVLVLPDAEKPVCSVISESYSEEFANELSNIYINKIKEISRS